MKEDDKTRLIKKLKRQKRKMKTDGADSTEISKIRRAIKKLEGDR